MNEELRKSLPAKISALGLSIGILFGNFWLIDLVFGTEPAAWKIYGSAVGCAVTILGAVSLLTLMARQYLNKP